MNLVEERENLLYKTLSVIMETPSISAIEYMERLSVEKEELYSILDIIDAEKYARNIKLAHGKGGKVIAVSGTAVVTDKGIQFIKQYTPAEQYQSLSHNMPTTIEGLPTVFISYNWNNNDFANDIESSLTGKAVVRRDKKDIRTWGSITEFMKSIRKQDFAVLIISDAYLKSSACLFEVVQLMKDDEWAERTMYIVMSDAHNIYKAVKRADYISYWDQECKLLERKISELPTSTILSLSEELNKSHTILLSIDAFLSMVADANNPTTENAITEIMNRLALGNTKIISDSNESYLQELLTSTSKQYGYNVNNHNKQIELQKNVNNVGKVAVLTGFARGHSGYAIYELIAQHPDGIIASEISAKLGITRAVVYRWLRMLEERELVISDPKWQETEEIRRCVKSYRINPENCDNSNAE